MIPLLGQYSRGDKWALFFMLWWGGGVVGWMLDFRSEGRWFEAQYLPSCCFLRQETLLHIVSLHPGVKNGYRRHTAGVNPAMDKHPIQEEVAILSVASSLDSCRTLPTPTLFCMIPSAAELAV